MAAVPPAKGGGGRGRPDLCGVVLPADALGVLPDAPDAPLPPLPASRGMAPDPPDPPALARGAGGGGGGSGASAPRRCLPPPNNQLPPMPPPTTFEARCSLNPGEDGPAAGDSGATRPSESWPPPPPPRRRRPPPHRRLHSRPTAARAASAFFMPARPNRQTTSQPTTAAMATDKASWTPDSTVIWKGDSTAHLRAPPDRRTSQRTEKREKMILWIDGWMDGEKIGTSARLSLPPFLLSTHQPTTQPAASCPPAPRTAARTGRRRPSPP